MISFGRKREVNLKVLKVPEIEQKVITSSSDNSRCTPTFCRFYYTYVCAYELKLNFLVVTNQKFFFFFFSYSLSTLRCHWQTLCEVLTFDNV